MRINIADIVIDKGTQHRQVEPSVSLMYQERMSEGDIFPPVEVYLVGSRYILTDGFHRVSASIRNGHTEIEAEVKTGTLREAVLASYGANKTNGYQARDIRKLVIDFYDDERTNAWTMTQAEVAKLIGCSHSYVKQICNELTGEGYKAVNKVAEPEAEPNEYIKDPEQPIRTPVSIADARSPECSKPKPVFEFTAEANRLLSLCHNISADIKQIEKLTGRGFEYLANHRDSDISAMRHLIRNLMSYVPVRACPQCAGKRNSCALCNGMGYITSFQESNLPAGLLEALE